MIRIGARQLFLTLVLIAASACTEAGKPVQEHASAAGGGPTPPSTQEDAGPSGGTKSQEAQVFETATDPLNAAVLPLAARVLDVNRVGDPASLTKREIQDELIELNSMILRLPEASRSSPAFADLTEKYLAALNFECAEIKDSCVGLKYFQLAANSSQVVRGFVALRKPEAMRLLLLAAELKNRQADPELLKAIVTYFPSALPAADAKIQTALTAYLDTALQSIDISEKDPKALRTFLESIDAWSVILGRAWKLGPGATHAMWMMLARSGMLYDGDSKPHPKFALLIKEANEATDSLFAKQNELRTAKHFVPEALGAKYIENFDDLFYIVDSVYTKRMTAEGAAELFAASGRPAKDLAAMIENYSRLQFAYGMYKSTLMAIKIFNAEVATNQLLFQVLPQSAKVKQIWGAVQEPLYRLSIFSSQALRSKDAVLERKTVEFLESFTRTVTIASVYPHTLLLFHYLSQESFKLTLLNAGELNSSNIMVLAYHGFFLPLLKYAENGTQLNNVEILYAFDLAIRSALFQTAGVDPDFYISDTLIRLTENHMDVIKFNLERVDQRITRNTRAAEMLSVCEGLKSGRYSPRALEFNELQASPFFGKFTTDMMRPVNALDGATGSAANTDASKLAQGIFFADSEYIEALERARLDLGQHLRNGEIMLKSYTSYLQKYRGVSTVELARMTAKTRAQLQKVRDLRKRALVETRHWQKLLGTCYYRAVDKEWSVVEDTIEAEERFLRKVHRDMKALRDPSMNEAGRRVVEQSYRFSGLPGGFTGLDRISAEGYLANQADFFIRVAGNLKSIAPEITVNMGSKLSADNPLIRFGEKIFLPYVESEDEFAASGLRAYFRPDSENHRSLFANWFSPGYRTLGWGFYMRVMDSLYRLETEIDPGNRSLSAADILREQEAILKTLAYSKKTRRLMGILGLGQKTDLPSLNGRLVEFPVIVGAGRPSLQSVWGLYDLPVMTMNLEKMGKEIENAKVDMSIPALERPYRFGFMELGHTYYKARAPLSRGVLMTSFNPDLDRFMDGRIGGFVRSELEAIQSFHRDTVTYLSEVAKLPDAERPRADITTTLTLKKDLLREALIHSFEYDAKVFQQKTQSCYVAACPEFN